MYYVFAIIASLQNRLDNAKDRGATATEYALLVAFIAVAIVIAVTLFGTQLSDFFTNLGNKIGLVKGSGASTA